jgi:L-ascorbate metabolism protein UlaG (beta-lactamase superfamily)
MEIPSKDSYNFPLAPNNSEFLRSNGKQNTLTWIGHATVLVQLGGKNILTDPHFSDRASPVQFAGPKRMVRPGVSLDELPAVHAVVISHDHYDSLDKTSIVRLHSREGGEKTIFFVPLGLKGWFKRLEIHNVVELDWWESRAKDGYEVICLPMHHWSQRVPFSRNTTLWAGWVIRNADFSFFFSGDSGYAPHFREIGEKLGPFDISAIPIGAYEPRWFMRHHHLSPEEAVQAHLDVKSKKSVAIHWGTFVLSDEPLDQPPKKLEEAKRARGVPPDEFVVLKHGGTIVLQPD